MIRAKLQYVCCAGRAASHHTVVIEKKKNTPTLRASPGLRDCTSQPSWASQRTLLRSPFQLINNRLDLLRSVRPAEARHAGMSGRDGGRGTGGATAHRRDISGRGAVGGHTRDRGGLRRSGAPQVVEQRVHVDRRCLGRTRRGRAGVGVAACLRVLEGRQESLQGRVVELPDYACQVRRRRGRLGLRRWSRVLRVRVRIAGGRCLSGIGLAVVGRRVRRPGLGQVGSRLRLLSQHKLRRHGRVDALVEFEPDAAGSGPDEDLDGNLALRLGRIVQVDDRMNALDDLALYHSVAWEPGVEVYDVGLQASVVEGSLDPAHKVSRDLLEEEDLDIGHV